MLFNFKKSQEWNLCSGWSASIPRPIQFSVGEFYEFIRGEVCERIAPQHRRHIPTSLIRNVSFCVVFGAQSNYYYYSYYITRHCFLAFETLPNDELLYIIIHITLTNIHSPISQSFSLLLYPNLMCFSCEYEKWPQLTVNQNAMLNLNKWMNKWKITELLTRELIRWNKKLYKKKNGTEKCLHVQHAHFRINRINLAATLERRFYSMHK